MPVNLFTDAVLTHADEDFLTNQLGTDVVLFDIGEHTTAELLTWHDLDDILSTRPLSAPRLRLTQQARDIPVEYYTRPVTSSGEQRRALIPEAVYQHLRDGATLILEAIDRLHPPIRDAVDDLVRLVREAAQANLYLVWGDVGGFGTHWDDHDTFIVQIAGSKHWTVHGPATHPYPMAEEADHSHHCPDGAVWDGVLTPGQILHVPRGWWHTVHGTGQWSVHLTFGYTRATGMSWLRWLLDQLINEAAFRQDLPRFASPQQRSAHHQQLVQHLATRAAQDGIETFLADRDARVPRRQRVCLPWPVAGDVPPLSAVVEFTPLLPNLSTHGEQVILAAGGLRFTFARTVGPVLDTLTDKRRLSLEELLRVSTLSASQFHSVLDVLLRHHLIVIDRPESRADAHGAPSWTGGGSWTR